MVPEQKQRQWISRGGFTNGRQGRTEFLHSFFPRLDTGRHLQPVGSGSGRVRAGLRPGGAPSLPAKGAKGQGRTRQAQTPLTGRGNRTLLAPDAGRAEPRGRSPGTDARRGAARARC